MVEAKSSAKPIATDDFAGALHGLAAHDERVVEALMVPFFMAVLNIISDCPSGMGFPVLCQKWIGGNERDIGRIPSASMAWRCVETEGFGTPMTAPKTGMTIPLPLQFLAAWLAVWLGRVLQEQAGFLRAENRLLREKLGEVTDSADRLGGVLGFYYREAA